MVHTSLSPAPPAWGGTQLLAPSAGSGGRGQGNLEIQRALNHLYCSESQKLFRSISCVGSGARAAQIVMSRVPQDSISAGCEHCLPHPLTRNETKTSHKPAGGRGQGGEGKTLRSLIFEAAPVKAKPASLLHSIFPLRILTGFALAKEGVVSLTFIPVWEKKNTQNILPALQGFLTLNILVLLL